MTSSPGNGQRTSAESGGDKEGDRPGGKVGAAEKTGEAEGFCLEEHRLRHLFDMNYFHQTYLDLDFRKI